MDNFIPDMYQKSIYKIDYQKLKDNGIKCILFDLDNTCAPLSVDEPTKKLLDLFEELKDMEFKIIIFSNASKKRVAPFKNKLLVDCCANARKPYKEKFLKILKTFKFNLSEVAIVGDQLYRDILGGNRVGITTVLVNPLSPDDEPWTRIFRYFERRKFAKMERLGIFTRGKYYD